MTNGFERYTKKTRRAEFLEEMEQVVPWAKLCALIEPHYPKAGNGRPPVGVERMLRIYFLQQWFNLSDPAVEEALYDSVVMREFVGIDLGREPVPDETTVCKFRHLLEEHGLGGEMLEAVNLHLEGKGVRITNGNDRGRDDHPCAQLDQEPGAGARPGDAADQEGRAVVLRDEGARGRGQPDEDDPQGGGDGGERGGCQGAAAAAARGRDAGVGRPGLCGTDRGDSRMRAAGAGLHQPTLSLSGRINEVERARNRNKSQVRSKVEHVFRVMKLKFGFVKVRYRGLKKNGNRLFATCALVNLFMVRKKLLRTALA